MEERSQSGDTDKQSEPDFKSLHDQIKDSTDKNRNFFFAYLALMIYVQATVFSTTDKMLLLSFEGIKLPLIDLMFPLLGFYWVIPIFVLALHFNLLQNLESHHYKLMQWRYAFPGMQVPRSRIHAFLFDFAVLEQGSVLGRLLRAISAVLYLYLGPLTLALVLWRMTDYQDPWLTGWHTLAFLFNCWLVARTRRGFRANAAAKSENVALGVGVSNPNAVDSSTSVSANGALSVATQPIRRWPRWGYRAMVTLCIGLVLAEAGLGIVVATLSSEHFLKLFSSSEAFGLTEQPSLAERVLKLVSPQIHIDPNDTVYEPNETKLKTLAALAGQSNWVKWFDDYGTGLDLRGRSLRGAQLSRQLLPKTLMQGTQLERANFDDEQLQEAIFYGARLQGTSFNRAQLQGASFLRAQLQGADFFSAQLHGASFVEAQLQGADFIYAQLQGAVFLRAQLQGADFTEADFTGANLDNSQLQGAIGITSNTPVLGKGPGNTSLNPIDWAQLQQLADTIPDKTRKRNYLERLALAQKAKPLLKKDLPVANSQAVPGLWAKYFCQTQDQESADSAQAGVQVIFKNLQIMQIMQAVFKFDQKEVTNEFSRLLCTKSECQPLRDKLRKQNALTCPCKIP